ncbi:MAG TPA: hypothetical protein VFP47_07390, partial [Pyrinomonadaceae bacterium]|nr:hypothetical protein [Pyrinomonadaceae bacterium]
GVNESGRIILLRAKPQTSGFVGSSSWFTHPKFLISNAKRNNNNPTTAGANENTSIQIGSDLNENLVTFMAFDR